MDFVYYPDYLEHHGILGQKWGVRRFQNSDGSLTSEGKKRYGSDKSGRYSGKEIRAIRKERDAWIERKTASDKNYKKAKEDSRRLESDIKNLQRDYHINDDGEFNYDPSNIWDRDWFHTPAQAKRAQDKYWNMKAERDDLDDRMQEIASSYVVKGRKYVSDKYGDVAVKQLAIRDTAAVAGAIAAVAAVPLAAVLAMKKWG